jgi:preprotein translocase subunit SecD
MSNLKYRLLIIAVLIAASVWTLFPRTVVERVNRNGQSVLDTVRRVPLRRGLDLQGGMHLTLEVDEAKGVVQNKSDALDRAIRVVRTRIDELGVAEPTVQKAGDDRIFVELPGVNDPVRAQSVIQRAAFLEFQITDKTQALERSLPRLDAIAVQRLPKVASAGAVAGAAAPAAAPAAGKAPMSELFTTNDTSRRADSTRRDTTRRDTTAVAATARDTTKPADSAAAATARTGAFSKAVTQGPVPGLYYVTAPDYDRLKPLVDSGWVQEALPPGKVMRWGIDTIVDPNSRTSYRSLYVLDSRPIITGEYLTDARPQSDPVEGNKVDFQLNREGGRRFQNETGRHIKDHMAVVLDQRVITAPQIQSAIGTNGQITLGSGSLQEAQDLAIVLRAGALPVPLKVAETREIGPSLGRDSINKGLVAGAVAVGLVIVIMIGYYKLSGLLAVGALVLYVLYTMAVLAGFDATLTLPGIAGFVLSVGIAVDANVLIFERIREELDAGRNVRSAIDEGFRHAMSAIVDSSVSTALTALVLYQFGTGPVKGFAVTLLAGIAASMVTSIFVTRTLYMLWLGRSTAPRTLSI